MRRRTISLQVNPQVWEKCNEVKEHFDVNWSRIAERAFKLYLERVFIPALFIKKTDPDLDVIPLPVELYLEGSVYEGVTISCQSYPLVLSRSRKTKPVVQEQYVYLPEGDSTGKYRRMPLSSLRALVECGYCNQSIFDEVIDEEAFFRLMKKQHLIQMDEDVFIDASIERVLEASIGDYPSSIERTLAMLEASKETNNDINES